MFRVLMFIQTIHQYIIEKDKHGSSKIRLKYLIHNQLECGRSICEPEGHDKKLVVAFVGLKGCFRDVFFLHSNMIVSGFNIQFGENLRSVQLVQQFINHQYRKLILYCDPVQTSVIHAKPPRSIF